MAIATVLPVLGLALLLVARSHLIDLVEKKRPLALALFPFIVCLPSIVVVELVALAALLQPNAIGAYWETVALCVVALHLGLLFWSPLVMLVSVIYGHWFIDGKTFLASRRAARQVRSSLRKVRRTQREFKKLIVRLTSALDGRAVWLRELPFNPTEPVGLVAARRAKLVSDARDAEFESSRIASKLAELDEEVREVKRQQGARRRNSTNGYARLLLNSFNVSVGHVQASNEGPREFDTELPRALAELDALYRDVTGHLPARPGREPNLAAAVARELERMDAEATDLG